MAHPMHMVDMARTPEEVEQSPLPALAETSRYPYGLCIHLTEHEIEKLGLDHKDCSVGDMLHLHCMATVTACSESQAGCRIELQITHISAEDEDEENEEEEESEEEEKPRNSSNGYGLYKY